jgi:hypothetical protein
MSAAALLLWLPPQTSSFVVIRFDSTSPEIPASIAMAIRHSGCFGATARTSFDPSLPTNDVRCQVGFRHDVIQALMLDVEAKRVGAGAR